MSTQSNRFGKYLLLDRIGVGGMAEVFKAKVFGAEGFERLVAIKRILPHLVEDEDFVKMFIDEAKIAVRLSHPNIVAIHDLGKADGTLFIAMEFVQGRDLRAIYDYEAEVEGHPPIGVAAHVVMKMCEALHHAHFATGPRGEPLNVIHRDVSPQNVMVSFDGEVKVADFGLAKARGRMVQTQAGVVKGKLAYMSPEQLRGEEIDHRVDVFGLGIVLFEMLTGERLFLGPSDMETLRRVYDATVPPMQKLNQAIQPELEAIVRRALAKDRDERYQTALELHDDLQTFVYSTGNYVGSASLRKYLREAFPDIAPAPAMPPFAAAAAAKSQAPTAAPPPPPKTAVAKPSPRPSAPVSPAASPSPAPTPPTAPGARDQDADLFAMSSTDNFDLSSDEADTGDFAARADDHPTDRPPAMDDIITPESQARQASPAHPEASGTVPSSGSSLPRSPAGLYADAPETGMSGARPAGGGGHETGPVTAPEEDLTLGFESDGWDDDEPTLLVRGGVKELADDEEDDVQEARTEQGPAWTDETEESTAVRSR